VAPVVGLFYKAMQDGRPIILDEMNAIPHTALIALNDLLTLKKGDTVTPIIPGIKPFKVKEGFCVIATGNWKPEDGKGYFGRQALDAAFLSRFGMVNYDYLPQRISGEIQGTTAEIQRKEKEENQLYDIMVCSLMDESLGVDTPPGTMQKLKSLARSARIIQDIFSEKETSLKIHDPRKDINVPAKDTIQENVLSIRHLIPILSNWKNEGYSHSLEHYIMKDYLERSSHSRDTEKIALYQILQSNGLFSKDKNWPDALSKSGIEKLLDFKIIEKMYGRDKLTELELPETIIDLEEAERKRLPLIKVIEEIYGPLPERKKVSPRIFKGHKEKTVDLDLDKIREIDETRKEIEKRLLDSMTGLRQDSKDKKLINIIKKYFD
jgi:hypothetical protein